MPRRTNPLWRTRKQRKRRGIQKERRKRKADKEKA
jgi:hypothetical protein